ncbi:glutamate racemase [Blattabacterium cuenoti]|uniref:glutamate racemase n=1 Tax=Blattabacterium cuenoti TaxID=1653831 RepID=UPI00163C4199|nr:glutamate racemase [Blattabacterium cuenoti]
MIKVPSSPIGIFDSGIGGLLIAKEIQIHMPNEWIIYFGDTENMPYGNKSKEFIRKYSMRIASFLYKKKCKAIVVACNTIVSNALNNIQEEFGRKLLIFNVIEPIIKNKTLISSIKRIGIMGTPATIRSNFFIKEIKKYFHHLDLENVIQQIATPLLAPIIENGFEKKNMNPIVEFYLNRFQSIDTLLLACTHYLFIKNEINNFFHGKVHIIDVQKIVVQYIQKKLYDNNLLYLNNSNKNTISIQKTWNDDDPLHPPIFYTTSNSVSSFFKEQVKILFGKKVFFKTHIFNFFLFVHLLQIK